MTGEEVGVPITPFSRAPITSPHSYPPSSLSHPTTTPPQLFPRTLELPPPLQSCCCRRSAHLNPKQSPNSHFLPYLEPHNLQTHPPKHNNHTISEKRTHDSDRLKIQYPTKQSAIASLLSAGQPARFFTIPKVDLQFHHPLRFLLSDEHLKHTTPKLQR